MTWKEYEVSVVKYLMSKYPNYKIRHDVSLIGIRSGRSRQVDILMEDIKNNYKVAIDCKFYKKKIDLKTVEEFIGFLGDLNVSKGIIITNEGISKSIKKRIENSSIRVNILNETDLLDYNLAYSGVIYTNLLSFGFNEPLGWSISTNNFDFPAQCLMFPVGYAFKEAINDGQFIYLDVIISDEELNEITSKQLSDMENHYQGVKVRIIESCSETHFREVFIKKEKAYELAYLKKYSKGIFGCYCITCKRNKNKNIKSIKEIVDSLIELPGLNFQRTQKSNEN